LSNECTRIQLETPRANFYVLNVCEVVVEDSMGVKLVLSSFEHRFHLENPFRNERDMSSARGRFLLFALAFPFKAKPDLVHGNAAERQACSSFKLI
jgi:hypothetical protein